jgi:hypothetical protein
MNLLEQIQLRESAKKNRRPQRKLKDVHALLINLIKNNQGCTLEFLAKEINASISSMGCYLRSLSGVYKKSGKKERKPDLYFWIDKEV